MVTKDATEKRRSSDAKVESQKRKSSSSGGADGVVVKKKKPIVVDISKFSKEQRYEHWKKNLLVKVMEGVGKSHIKPSHVRKFLRKSKNPELEDVNDRAKKLWEELRRTDVAKEKKAKVQRQLLRVIKGREIELASLHDASRVLQSVLKYATVEQRGELFTQLKPSMESLMVSKFGKFLVKKLIKRGNDVQKQFIFTLILKRVNKYLRHNESSEIVEMLYSDYAKLPQRNLLFAELYGKNFQLARETTDETIQKVCGRDAKAAVKISDELGHNLLPIIPKVGLRNSIIHKALADWFSITPADKCEAMITALRDQFPHMIHTLHGVEVACRVLWSSDDSQRVEMLQLLKGLVVKYATDDNGYLFIVAALECVGDTDAVQRYLINPLLDQFATVMEKPAGRLIVIHLLSPRDRFNFTPEARTFLALADELACSAGSRERLETLAGLVQPSLVVYLDENAATMLRTASSVNALNVFVTRAHDALLPVCERLGELVARPISADTSQLSVEQLHVTLFVKVITHFEKTADEKPFTETLASNLTPKIVKSWTQCNRGCFVLVHLLESGSEEAATRVRKLVSVPSLKKQEKSTAGLKLLLKKLT